MEKQLEELIVEVRQLKERVAYLEQKTGFSADIGSKPQVGEQFISTAENPSPQRMKIILRPKNKFSLSGMSEEKLAGTWFNRVGIIAIMLAVAFFLKWSFDNHLIGELGRIVIGIVIGLSFLGGGEYFQRRKFFVYGQGFTGGGIAILYFSIFAAFVFYHLISQPVAFLLMVLITMAASLLAVRYDSVVIGVMGIVGGFATPFLLSSGQSNRIILFTYIAILDLGVLVVAYYKKWPVFNYLTFFFTYISFAAGLAGIRTPYYYATFDTVSFSYLTLFFLIYLAVPFSRNIRLKESFLWTDIKLILLNAVIYFALSYTLLNPHIHDWIGFWAVFLGTMYLLLGLFIYRRHLEAKNLSLTLLAIAAGFMTVAIPLQFNGYWISMAWAMEAVIVFYLSFKINPNKIPAAGFLILILTFLSLTIQPFRITGNEPSVLLNKAAVAYLVFILAMALISWLYHRQTKEAKVFRNFDFMLFMLVSLNLVIILFFTLETNAYFDYLRRLAQRQEAYSLLNTQKLAISIIWGLHAATLIVLGFWRRMKGIRWFGLGFLGVVVLKVFFYDLSNLSTPNRIMSFMGLGVILLAISWLYHRYKNQIRGGNDDESQSGQ